MAKVIICSAITGSAHFPSMSDYLPITPKQIVDDAIKSYEAGAAMVHIHVRNPETGQPCVKPEYFREVCTNIKSKCDVVICPTTGGGSDIPDERIRVVKDLKPEIASFTPGSCNFGMAGLAGAVKVAKYEWEKEELKKAAVDNRIFANTFKTIREFAKAFNDAGTKPEFECFDVGFINTVAWMIREGLVAAPIQMQLVLGTLGAMPATPEAVITMHQFADSVLGAGKYTWSCLGPGGRQLSLVTLAMLMGGNVRIGLEDSVFAGKGVMAKSSADQVEKIVRIAKELSIEVASPDETRKALGLKGRDKVNF